MITVDGNCLSALRDSPGAQAVCGQSRDEGDVIVVGMGNRSDGVPGSVLAVNDLSQVSVTNAGRANDRFRVFARSASGCSSIHAAHVPPDAEARGFVWRDGTWSEVDVEIVPVRGELFSRFKGLLETSAIQACVVLMIGLGSVGSYVTDQLVKSGICQFLLMDHDRLKIGNIMRHVLGVSDVGRKKVLAMRDWLLEKNPYAEVKTWPVKAEQATLDLVRECVRAADVVVCTADNHAGRLLVNYVCAEQRTPLLIAGAYRRAYGCQVLRIRPFETLCYQCYMMMLPEKDRNAEIYNAELAAGIAYSDRPVPIEPGLSTDIEPSGIMGAKLVIQELLRGKETTLHCLDEDLIAPWYTYLNRREPDTPYANWGPLGFNVDGMRILRWYGVDAKPRPDCPVCGDFVGQMAREYDLEMPDEQLAVHDGAEGGESCSD